MSRPPKRRRSLSRKYNAFKDELLRDLAGGDVRLSVADVKLVEQAALLLTRAEMLRTAILAGETYSDETLIKVLNAAVRVLNALRSKGTKKPKRSLRDHLAARVAKMDLSNDQDGDTDY